MSCKIKHKSNLSEAAQMSFIAENKIVSNYPPGFSKKVL